MMNEDVVTTVTAYFKACSWHSSAGTEEKGKNLSLDKYDLNTVPPEC
jgi:hypothetical protein